ncbi:hypothetical protein [uncultured Phycicoccus sp.]|uniref:alpha/beta hydrolase n=1 Tax=uncultured Phycicoccus sp. TaxID=661422 RepID=UPI0026381160|nr:hypothetical protein [uncultured Phycicoccus sp.]
MDEGLEWDGAPGAAVLRLPDGAVSAGLVMLHGASDGRARQPLFDGLAAALAPLGIAALGYERRAVAGGDTPLRVQAADAVGAVRALQARLGRPVGVSGFSQGAWAAALAAADDAVGFLVVLGCSGVTPAEQMRFHTDELLRRRGFSDRERGRNRELRLRLEDHLRQPVLDRSVRDALDADLRAAAREPWFPVSYLPSAVPPGSSGWDDMDFDPVPSFGAVRVPVLAIWGEDEECVPREVSRDRWQESGADVTLVDLPGCGHWPVVGSSHPDYAGQEEDALAPSFTASVATWLGRWLSTAG